MPTQKIFKQRIRARMSKTGESYTAARRQLLQRATDPNAPDAEDPTAGVQPVSPPEPPATDSSVEQTPAGAYGVSDDAMVRATGRTHRDWFALLDTWGATEHGHTEIARWLSATHGVPGWWTQSVTVAYERARGMRARHQMRDGFSISVTRTVGTTPERALEAFVDPSLRARWLADGQMRQRPTRATMSARFDWSDPPSRVMVTAVPKPGDRTLVSVTHEQLPDADSAERLKVAWREWLTVLKATLEGE